MSSLASNITNAVLGVLGNTTTIPSSTGPTNPVQTNQQVTLLNSINMNTVLVSYSPIIITLCIILLSAFSQTMQGITFFLFLFLFSFIRIALIKLLVTPPSGGNSNNPDCVNFPIVSAYDNDGFNIFYITYLYGYIVTPMLTLVPMNYVLIIFLGIYLIYIFIQALRSNCVSGGYVVGNFFYAIISVTITMSIITACKIESQLFLYDSVSDAIKCSMPSKQSFKCSVYQNGQLISSNTT
jgi:hypothetical protein